ncbi:MAG TPA: diaminopimelate epimerase [Candidatus Ozemobacteraceae bacterium]|nr:diaminopimelate epimerase [Candidatus Ozemobacteraceae bacterium]
MYSFAKMHGLGNHFVFFDEMGQDFSRLKKPRIIQLLCDQRRGLGADGIIFIMDPRDPKHHCRMQMFNIDGTEAEMCGNAIRGVAHLFRTHCLGIEPVRIETGGGLREVRCEGAKDGTGFYRVEMGPATFDLVSTGELILEKDRKPLDWEGEKLDPVYVNVGNPHAVLFINEPWDEDEMVRVGAWLETHANHPRRINVEFVQVLSQHEVRVHVWERGCGMTQACGTGATGVTAAGIKTGRLQSPVTVHMPGGDLSISQEKNGTLYMAGPVQEVASGRLTAAFLRNLQTLV